ncbi:MAG: glycine-rich domain-containing protein [Pseudomonadota bacterium]
MNIKSNVASISLRQRLAGDPTLFRRMMDLNHAALKERMVVKYGWTAEFTEELFVELKKFLYLCATNDEAMAPPEDIDEIWHNFILFTGDYAAYCKSTVGFFLHHQPLTQAQRTSSDGSMVRNTIAAAERAFGELSSHWSFNKIPGSCGPGVCGASTNCQDG